VKRKHFSISPPTDSGVHYPTFSTFPFVCVSDFSALILNELFRFFSQQLFFRSFSVVVDTKLSLLLAEGTSSEIN
jgi:hypothetical protein